MLRILLLLEVLVVAIHASDYVNYPEVQQSYKFYRTPQKWFDARNTCQRDDASLAMPKNDAEMLVLKRIFDGYPATIFKNYTHPDSLYLGFHDLFKEGEFVTNKGIPIQYYYHTWSNGQPDNAGNKEHCGSMSRRGLLNDLPCHISVVFICQKNKKEMQNLKNFDWVSTDLEYKYFNQSNKFYKLHLNPKIWSEALTVCLSEGGNLAIVNNKAEEDFLLKMFASSLDKIKLFNNDVQKNYALLGFHDLFEKGHFVTVNDDELQNTGYTKWGLNQPDFSVTQDCGSMNSTGYLYDFSCNFSTVFFCEIKINTQFTVKDSDPEKDPTPINDSKPMKDSTPKKDSDSSLRETESSVTQNPPKKHPGNFVLYFSFDGK